MVILRIIIIVTLASFWSGCQSETLNNNNKTTGSAGETAHELGVDHHGDNGRPSPGNEELAADVEAGEDDSDSFSIDDLFDEDFEEESPTVAVNDPWESMNRSIFKFNDGFYTHFFIPVADTYESVVPDPMETAITNFFDNLKFPLRFVTYSLQGNFGLVGRETGRFIVDSTMGFGGLLRPSDDIRTLTDLPSTDLGLTFAYWGIDFGPYLVLPVFGPSSGRDVFNLPAEYFLDPVNYIDDGEWETGLSVLEILNESPKLMADYQRSKESAIDHYSSLRDFYIQLRNEDLRRLKDHSSKK